MKKIILTQVGLLAGLMLSPGLALAGGGPIFLEVQPYSPFSEFHAYVVEAHITPDINFDYNCRDIPVTFKLENPQPGDRISAGDFDKGNPTAVILGYNER